MKNKYIPYSELVKQTKKFGDCLNWTGKYRDGYPVMTVPWCKDPVSVRRMVMTEVLRKYVSMKFYPQICGNPCCVKRSHIKFDFPVDMVDVEEDTSDFPTPPPANDVIEHALKCRTPLFTAWFAPVEERLAA